MLGAAAGVAMGVVAGCTGALGLAAEAGAGVDLPELFSLFLLAIPVGLILCPGLVLWGTVAAWRIAETAPDDAFPAPHGATAAAGELDPLDTPFDPLDAPFDPPAGGGAGG